MIWTLLIIQFLVVAITDYSGFTEDAIKPLFKKWFVVGTPSKIFICSFCQNWWLGLIALLITGNFTLPWIAAVMGLSILTPVTYLLITFVRDFLEKIIETLYKIFGL